MSDLETAAWLEADRLERLHGRAEDPTHRALRAALDMHEMCNCGLHCAACNLPMPCPEVRTVAEVLGIEVSA